MQLNLSPLSGMTLLITGGTGMIGKWMIDLLKVIGGNPTAVTPPLGPAPLKPTLKPII